VIRRRRAEALCGIATVLATAVGGAAQESPLEVLGWMSGCWSADGAGSRTEELWTTPEGGLLIGLSRSLSAGGATAFEYMRIESAPGGTTFHASPGGGPATTFPVVSADRGRLRVERPDHDFPKAIEYRPVGADSLVARVFAEVDAVEPSFTLRFARVSCPGGPP
jgi:hypothetical protein